MIKELECKSALNRVNGRFPYKHDLNVYRGCTHGCKYCYALYSHRYMQDKDFYSAVYCKTGILPVLDKELGALPVDRVVNIGSVCDSYQSAEKEMKMMPKVLDAFIRHRVPVIISTKSDLILRDTDLIAELAETAFVGIASSVITTDDSLARIIEPGAPPPSRRTAMLREIKSKTKATVGLHCMPVLPYITDSEENLRSVFAEAKAAGVDYLLAGGLNMRGRTGVQLTDFVYRQFREVYPKFTALRNTERRREYKAELHALLSRLYREYGLTDDYRRFVDERLPKQLTFEF